jgi:signal peptidase I
VSSDINSNDSDYHDPAEDMSGPQNVAGLSPSSPSKRVRFAKEALALVLIGFLVIIFRSVAFEPFKIPTGSMIPSLRIGDFILVNKFAYGVKLPFSDLTIGSINLDPIYLFGKKDVKRGDVIVFKYPKDPSINYIKRVIGLPGETVEIKNKKVFINGTPLEEAKLDGELFMKTMDEKYRDNKLAFYQVKLKEKNFDYQIDEDNFFKVDYAKRKIPEGHYFVMGDNRDFSYDSRYWGVVPHKNIKGQAFLVWLSINSPDNSQESFSFRSERIGELIR